MSFFQNKIVWITGASSGIGEALVKAFAQENAFIILSSRKASELARVQIENKLTDQNSLILPLNLGDYSNLKPQIEQALAWKGKIDYMIHNGGISQRSLIEETEIDVDKKLMDVNYLGAVALTKGILPSMIKNQSGHFTVISSVVGIAATPMRSGYAASKHALHGFFDALRAETFKYKLGVLIVCPGFIKTNVSVNALTGDGSPQNKMDEAQANGIPADICAQKILKSIKNGKNEVYIGGFKEKLAIYLKRFLPNLFNKIIRKTKVT